jgi:hypothetical protein
MSESGTMPPVRRDFITRFTPATASIAAKLPRRPRPQPQLPQPFGSPVAPALDPFMNQQRDGARARMREINDAVAKELAKEDPDAQKVDRLAAAWAKLGELERTLDGRPLPGSMRPRPQRATRPAPLSGPLD